MNSWPIVLFLVLGQFPPTPAPSRTGGSASIEGIVVRLGTSEPISGVDLELTATTAPPAAGPGSTPPPQPPFTAKSGSDGKFAFRNLPSGTFKLVAARIGGAFVPAEYGQRGILGRGVEFPLGDGQQMRDVRMEMAPVGTITGRVFDENGKGIGHAAVLAFSEMYRGNERVLNIAQVVHTDDRGEYRLFSLVPGRYYVAARLEDPGRRTASVNIVPPGRRGPYEQAVSPVVTKRILPTGELLEETLGLVYYGGTTDVQRTTPLNLNPGGNLGAVDIPLAAGKAKALHIRGKVIDGTTGNPAAGAAVRLIPRTFSAFMILPNTTTDANGMFDLTGVSPGSYQIYFLGAQTPQRPAAPGVPPPPPLPPLMTMTPIEVANENIEGVTVTIVLGSTIAGKVTLEGRQDGDPELTRMQVSLAAQPNGVGMVTTQSGPVTASGSFSILNVWPADYSVDVTGIPANTYIKSIRMANRDLLGENLRIPVQDPGTIEILIGTDAGTLTGQVVNDRQVASSNVKVALVPDLPLRRRGRLYKSAATDLSGSFRLTAIAPGDYKIFAWEEVDDGAWRDAEFIRIDEARGKSIHIGPNRTESTNVTVIPARR